MATALILVTVLGRAILSPPREARAAEPRAGGCAALDVQTVHETQADFVWRSLQRLGIRSVDLEDVFQDVFVVVHRRLHTFDTSSALTTWLFGICLRVSAAHRRRAWFRREVPTADVAATHVAPAGERPDEALSRSRAQAALRRVLDAMDLDKRAVFVMFELDELSSEEIATILGVPVGTVWSRLHAARKQFEKILARQQARGRSVP